MIKEGDMLVLNSGSRVTVGYVVGTVRIEDDICYRVVEMSGDTEKHLIITEDRVIEGKQAYECILNESKFPLIHGINNGYQDW